MMPVNLTESTIDNQLTKTYLTGKKVKCSKFSISRAYYRTLSKLVKEVLIIHETAELTKRLKSRRCIFTHH